jgi:hypothetical protein
MQRFPHRRLVLSQMLFSQQPWLQLLDVQVHSPDTHSWSLRQAVHVSPPRPQNCPLCAVWQAPLSSTQPAQVVPPPWHWPAPLQVCPLWHVPQLTGLPQLSFTVPH